MVSVGITRNILYDNILYENRSILLQPVFIYRSNYIYETIISYRHISLYLQILADEIYIISAVCVSLYEYFHAQLGYTKFTF